MVLEHAGEFLRCIRCLGHRDRAIFQNSRGSDPRATCTTEVVPATAATWLVPAAGVQRTVRTEMITPNTSSSAAHQVDWGSRLFAWRHAACAAALSVQHLQCEQRAGLVPTSGRLQNAPR